MRGEAFFLRACTSNTATLSLLEAVITITGSVLSLNVKALCVSFPLLTAGFSWTIIFSFIPKFTLEPSLTCLNAKNKGQISGAALRLNFSSLGI